LVVLFFRNETSRQYVGYVERDGICGWPDDVSGRRPDGWLDLSSIFDGMAASAKRIVASAF
jgi:hypothetical protein